jgi:hypothetical protein
LAELIEYPTWRSLIYRLAEDYPDCLMLNFTIKLISDAGFQGEITSISTAAQQIEVFSRSVHAWLVSGPGLPDGMFSNNKNKSLYSWARNRFKHWPLKHFQILGLNYFFGPRAFIFLSTRFTIKE